MQINIVIAFFIKQKCRYAEEEPLSEAVVSQKVEKFKTIGVIDADISLRNL